MPTTDEIKQRIETAIPDSNAEVEDWTGGGDHFRATVVSPAFAGLSRIQQHRLVMDVFAGEIGGPLPAPRGETPTPQELFLAEQTQNPPPAAIADARRGKPGSLFLKGAPPTPP